MNIPGSKEWGEDLGDLDVACARKNFFGISLQQAEELFRKNALSYQEDIVFMPFPCFRFYVHAYMDYLLSDASRGDSDGASCFFTLIECRTSDIIRLSADAKMKLGRVLDKIASGQEYFDADKAIYGSFRENSENAKKKIQA